jgi:hypothetical protein
MGGKQHVDCQDNHPNFKESISGEKLKIETVAAGEARCLQ